METTTTRPMETTRTQPCCPSCPKEGGLCAKCSSGECPKCSPGMMKGKAGELEMKKETTGEPFGLHAQKMKENIPIQEIIMCEHNLVKQLYSEYKSASDLKVKESKAHLIINQLVQQAGKEEIALYPMTRSKCPDGARLVEKAKQEHQLVTDDLYKLDQMTLSEKCVNEYDALLHKIMTEWNEHITDEEKNLLPNLVSKCTEKELLDESKKYQSEIVTTRPHPWAPREGIPAAMAHATAVPIDAARDAARFTTAEKEATKKF